MFRSMVGPIRAGAEPAAKGPAIRTIQRVEDALTIAERGFSHAGPVRVLQKRVTSIGHIHLPRRGVQRACALTCKLSGGTTHSASCVLFCGVNRQAGTCGAQIWGWPRHIWNKAPCLTVRCLRIAGHHTVGRRRGKRSLKPPIGRNDVWSRSLRQGRIARSSHCQR